MTKIAVVQQDAVLADVPANLAMCERLAAAAADAGAEIVVLPDFFTTGMAFLPELVDRAQPLDRAAAQLRMRRTRRHA